MKKLSLLTFILFNIFLIHAQSRDSLETQKAEKQAEVKTAQAELNAIQAKIDALPGWRLGAFGIIGGSLSNFNNWYAQGAPNNSSGNIGITVNAYANLIESSFFWRNSLTTNLKWVKFDNEDIDTDDSSFNPTTDVFNISSLYGKNITKTLAASGMLEYRTTLLDNFNDPGYLDVGIGATWTPIDNLIIVVNPLNYNFLFSENSAVFESSLGTKIVADYTRQIGQINFKTNFSTFQSYKSNDLSNWTWNNAFSYNLWKMIGVGIDFGLRSNKQEALNYIQNLPIDQGGDPNATFGTIDNKLQTYYTIGLSYKF